MEKGEEKREDRKVWHSDPNSLPMDPFGRQPWIMVSSSRVVPVPDISPGSRQHRRLATVLPPEHARHTPVDREIVALMGPVPPEKQNGPCAGAGAKFQCLCHRERIGLDQHACSVCRQVDGTWRINSQEDMKCPGRLRA